MGVMAICAMQIPIVFIRHVFIAKKYQVGWELVFVNHNNLPNLKTSKAFTHLSIFGTFCYKKSNFKKFKPTDYLNIKSTWKNRILHFRGTYDCKNCDKWFSRDEG